MSAMNIPRDQGPKGDDQAPGTWRHGTSDGSPTAFFRCPQCPTLGALAGTHDIAADGTVTPSVVCPNCSFHEWIKLDGWPA
jgi:hypothetical protein